VECYRLDFVEFRTTYQVSHGSKYVFGVPTQVTAIDSFNSITPPKFSYKTAIQVERGEKDEEVREKGQS
jgi:hypothetical protein